MRLQSLIHLTQAALAMVRCREIIVLGSASLLASHPALGEPGQPLETTLDADLLPDPVDEESARVLDEALGDGSLFAAREGFHADILRPAIRASLPRGWEARLVPLPRTTHVRCLHPLDLALSKLIGVEALREHYLAAELNEKDATRAGRNLQALARR